MQRLDQLYFYLTEGCNLACRHCWLAPKLDPEGTRYPVLPAAAFERAIDEAMPLGLAGVKLTGGEPLLHPEIGRLLELVRARSLELTVETNGALCTPELAQAIAASAQCFVSVSLDGVDAETHDGVRGVAGSFDLALQALRNLVAAGISPQIILSLMRVNAGQVAAVARLAEQVGAASLKLNVVQPSARGAKFHASAQGLSVPELIDLHQGVTTEIQPLTPIRILFDIPIAFRPLSAIADGDASGQCNVLGILGVLPTAHYALCGIGESVPELVFGKVGEDALADLWQGHPTLLALRQGLPAKLGGVCASCLMRHRCLGSCVAQNYYGNKDLFAPFWFCEQAFSLGLFPGSRQGQRRARGDENKPRPEVGPP